MPPRNVVLYGEQNDELKSDIIALNIYGTGSMKDINGNILMHPNFLTKLLSDIFGIQVRTSYSLMGPSIKILGIT